MLSVASATPAFDGPTRFEVPPAKPGRGRPPTSLKADRDHTQVKALAASLPKQAWHTVTYRDLTASRSARGSRSSA